MIEPVEFELKSGNRLIIGRLPLFPQLKGLELLQRVAGKALAAVIEKAKGAQDMDADAALAIVSEALRQGFDSKGVQEFAELLASATIVAGKDGKGGGKLDKQLAVVFAEDLYGFFEWIVEAAKANYADFIERALAGLKGAQSSSATQTAPSSEGSQFPST